MDKQLFVKVCDEIIGQRQGLNGIGTLGEKTVHSVLKSYYSPDQINHEIKVSGFVADICTGSEIIEIQTRDFNKLRRKLSAFLAFAPVTIVYPIPYIKWLRWVNPQTGEISPPRKSPKTGKPYLIFNELYRIKEHLLHPNLRLRIILINLEEYRFLDGWSQDKKKGSTRCDRIPTELVDEIRISNPEEYQVLIPDCLGDEFTSKDFKKATGLPMNHSQTALNVLNYIGAVERIGKKGNSFLYTRRKDADKGTVAVRIATDNAFEENTAPRKTSTKRAASVKTAKQKTVPKKAAAPKSIKENTSSKKIVPEKDTSEANVVKNITTSKKKASLNI